MEALGRGGAQVELVSTFRSYDGDGDAERQQALKVQGEAHALVLARRWQEDSPQERPRLWFTYHVYYKAPDWLGPIVTRELRIPYVIAEPSHAPKRAEGAWELGYDAAAEAIRRAALLISPSRDDIACLRELAPPERILHLPPFLDLDPYRAA